MGNWAFGAALATLLLALPAQAQSVDPIDASRGALRRAEQLWKEGYVGAACARYSVASVLAPEWWYPAALGRHCGSTAPDATRLLREALAKEANGYWLNMALSELLRVEGDRAASAFHTQRALLEDENNVVLVVELASDMLALGRQAAAMALLTRAIELSPATTTLLRRYATVAEEMGHLVQAEWGFRHLAIVGSNPQRNITALAGFYSRHGCGRERGQMTSLLGRRGLLQPSFNPSTECLKILGTTR